jgi:outer membrane protein assembly factor BamB
MLVNHGRRRVFGWSVGIGAGILLAVGAALAIPRLDLKHHRADAKRLEKLAKLELRSAVSSAGASDWPQWRGPNRDGVSLETGLLPSWPTDGPRVLWKRPIGRGFSSVAVVAGRLYTMDADEANEAVVCLDALTGAEVWRCSSPCRFDERFGTGPRSTPAVDGRLVYAVGPTGMFHCCRADTGAVVWRHDLGAEFHARPSQYGVSFSPLIEGELVYAMPGGSDGNSIVAFDKQTGALAWKALDDPIGYSSPVAVTAAGVRQLLCFTNTTLVSLSPRDGKTYWRYQWEPEGGQNIATPIAFDNYVFISSGYGKGCALLEITAGPDGLPGAQAVYEHNRMRNHFTSSVRLGEHIYGFDQQDLVCMDIRTGDIVWREKGQRIFGKGSLLIADGRLLVMCEDGHLILAEATPAGYHPISKFRVFENKCWTVPVLAHGKLYVRDESEIACLSLKE